MQGGRCGPSHSGLGRSAGGDMRLGPKSTGHASSRHCGMGRITGGCGWPSGPGATIQLYCWPAGHASVCRAAVAQALPQPLTRASAAAAAVDAGSSSDDEGTGAASLHLAGPVCSTLQCRLPA